MYRDVTVTRQGSERRKKVVKRYYTAKNGPLRTKGGLTHTTMIKRREKTALRRRELEEVGIEGVGYELRQRVKAGSGRC
jgi:hypothetical protein